MLHILPKAITANFGLPAKLSDLNRDIPMRYRIDGLYIQYEHGKGVIANRKTGEIYGYYTQFENNKYKLVKGVK